MSYFRLDYYHKKYLITSNYILYLVVVWSWGKTSSFAARAWWEVVGKQADRWDMCCYSQNVVAWNSSPYRLFWLSFVSSFATLEVQHDLLDYPQMKDMRRAKSITNLRFRRRKWSSSLLYVSSFCDEWQSVLTLARRANVLTGIQVFIPDILYPRGSRFSHYKAKALWTKEYFCYSWRGISWWWDSVVVLINVPYHSFTKCESVFWSVCISRIYNILGRQWWWLLLSRLNVNHFRMSSSTRRAQGETARFFSLMRCYSLLQMTSSSEQKIKVFGLFFETFLC